MNQTVNNFTWVNLNNEGFYTRPAKRHHNGKVFFGIEVVDLFNKLDKSAVQKSNIEIHKINKTNVLNIYFLNTNINLRCCLLIDNVSRVFTGSDYIEEE